MKAIIKEFRDHTAERDIQNHYSILQDYLVVIGQDSYWFGQSRGTGFDGTIIEWDVVEGECNRIVEWDGMVIGDAELDIVKWLGDQGYEVEVKYERGKVAEDSAGSSQGQGGAKDSYGEARA